MEELEAEKAQDIKKESYGNEHKKNLQPQTL
jgi:hypothetical protein